jgi:hypothetical protein
MKEIDIIKADLGTKTNKPTMYVSIGIAAASLVLVIIQFFI